MQENNSISFTTDVSPSGDKLTWYPVRCKITKPKLLKYPPGEDIELWLKHNAPLTFQQLADIRYALYHHCSRADFTVANINYDQFDFTGRHGTLRVASDNARRYLLWKLSLLGRKKNWIRLSPERETRDEGNRFENNRPFA